ncbi:MAG: hypothetical protein FJ386_06655 [Verrucomicrobia bacterium]|nr:hypothetical protein [Verrucomicrobiota bacterium]
MKNTVAIRFAAAAALAGALLSFAASAEQEKQKLDPAEKAKRDAAKAEREKAAQAPHPSGPEAAQAAMKTFTTPEGLEATLWASEPRLINPACMDIDSRGRIWIAEGANYRRWSNPPLRPEGDRILILEDTNGDGKADKSTTFYQGTDVNNALGLCVLGNKVIVSCSPNIFVFTDENGDDKADKKELLFTKTGQPQHDHSAHSFVFGPDGKLYWNFGNTGKSVHDKDGNPVKDVEGTVVNDSRNPFRQGMVFRCNLDGSQFEVLGWNFRNNYEVAVDSFGSLWQSDNDDDGNKGVRINFVMEFGNYGYTEELTGAGWGQGWNKAKAKGESEDNKILYQWHLHDPGVVPNLLHTGQGSPTGIAVYEGNLLPAPFRNQVIHCDAGPRTTRAYPVTKSGAGYTAQSVDLLTSTETWYRPADVCVAPDGSVFIADWHDAGVGGHNMADRDLATMTGRIYRVAPKGHKPTVPAVNLKSAAGGVAALQSPNLATRYIAWTALHGMQGKAESELKKLWTGTDPRQRARALHLLARIKGMEMKYIEDALKDANEDIRATGLRIARERGMDVPSTVKKLTGDASALVRRECAIALRHSKSPEAPKLWAQLALKHDGKDRWYLEALGIGADKNEAACLDAWLAAVGDKWNSPAGRDILWRSRAPKAATLLAKIATDKTTTEAEKARYIRALDFIPKCKEKDDALAAIALGGI